jgi:hypothetical protein
MGEHDPADGGAQHGGGDVDVEHGESPSREGESRLVGWVLQMTGMLKQDTGSKN